MWLELRTAYEIPEARRVRFFCFGLVDCNPVAARAYALTDVWNWMKPRIIATIYTLQVGKRSLTIEAKFLKTIEVTSAKNSRYKR
ncbi:hypothetical protein ACTABV_22375 [Pseudomonas fragariae (ex Marin et al. 2024)]|uniref:hypothetical protein n=1 Tax=Pseudomonas fragariae (ex Marin et al. 2024) TaxID=3080056 RepID=UPI003F8785D0